jgi:hypothetical protein
VTCMFTTHASTGAPVAPSTALENADVLIFKNGSASEKTTQNGVTMTSPFNSVTGLHCLTIDTSNDTGDGGFWVAGAVYTLVLSPDETVDSVAVAKVIGQFGIDLAGVLRPTTAGRTLDVSAGGEAGIDWANIGSPTTAVNLSATNIDVDQVVASVSGAVGSVTGAVGSVTGNVGGNVTGSVGSVVGLDTSIRSAIGMASGTYDVDILDIDNAIAGLNNLSAAQVNAEVVDALATDTYAEPTGVPAATDDLATKISYIYMALRNRLDITASKKQFYDDGGAVEWEKDLSDDGTTYSESEANAP